MTDNPTIQELSYEDRTFPPPPEFAAQANVQADEYDKAEADRLGFWAEKANRISWDTPFDEVLDCPMHHLRNGSQVAKLNAAYNCADRHVVSGSSTGWPIILRVKAAIPGPSPTPIYCAKFPKQPMR